MRKGNKRVKVKINELYKQCAFVQILFACYVYIIDVIAIYTNKYCLN